MALPPQRPSAAPGPLRALALLTGLRWRVLTRGARVLAVLGATVTLGVGVAVVAGARRLADDPETVALLAAAGVSSAAVAAALPLTFAAFLLTVTSTALGSSGGREVLPADQTVALPVGTTTDHLAALAWAPLTLAWVVPATALAAMVVVTSRHDVAAAETIVLLWLLAATATAQALAWLTETARGARRGPLAVRLAIGGVALLLGWALWTGRAATVAHLLGGDLLAAVVGAADRDDRGPSAAGILGLLGLLVVALRLGDRAAAASARRPPPAQAVLETRHHPLRPARSSEAALRRLDRAGVWRSAPLRRGLALLALLPLVLAVTGRVEWGSLPLLPGFFGLGGALLFGVNAFSLDAAGAWWRESLPVEPAVLLRVRARIVLEVVLLPSVATLVVGAVRAGPPPTTTAVVAAVGSTAVVVARVVASVLRWSVTRPYTVDLRRPRATPAPAGAMLVYSLRLTVHGIVYGALFTAVSALDEQWPWTLPLSLGLTVLLLLPSLASLHRTRRRWLDPARRSEVVRVVGAV